MFYAKACIKPSLEIVQVTNINFIDGSILYGNMEEVMFEDVMWIKMENEGRKKM